MTALSGFVCLCVYLETVRVMKEAQEVKQAAGMIRKQTTNKNNVKYGGNVPIFFFLFRLLRELKQLADAGRC